ncbi:hypothetical protein C2S52_004322 [Perilla frutescens var. hirtella]|nr:hypothetical protein C2S51_011250 [Perilla frutescens var. frutescens]KAH6793845.1 hypothetical protein C2S52_004322 [Perilla frutescens var. hirtella]
MKEVFPANAALKLQWVSFLQALKLNHELMTINDSKIVEGEIEYVDDEEHDNVEHQDNETAKRLKERYLITYDEDSYDELLEDIIYHENVNKDVEWVGTT